MEDNGFWDETLTKRAQVLLSLKPGDPVTGFQADLLAAMCQSIQPPNQAPDRAEILTILAEQIASQRQTLTAERDRLEREIDGPSRLEAGQRALADLSHAGALRLRHLNANDQAMHRSLRALQTAQINALTMPEPQREIDNFVSTSAEGTWLHVPRGCDGPRLARVLDRARATDNHRKQTQTATPDLNQTELRNEPNGASLELSETFNQNSEIPAVVGPAAPSTIADPDSTIQAPTARAEPQPSSNPGEAGLRDEPDDATSDSCTVYSQPSAPRDHRCPASRSSESTIVPW